MVAGLSIDCDDWYPRSPSKTEVLSLGVVVMVEGGAEECVVLAVLVVLIVLVALVVLVVVAGEVEVVV